MKGGKDGFEMRTTLPAALHAIEECCAEFRLRAAGLLRETESFAAELLLRESLTSAVVHGCRRRAQGRIHCILRVKPNSALIVVADEGEGFNWRPALRRRSSKRATGGRGIEILRLYATRVRFNQAGNTVAVFKRFSGRTDS